MFNVDLIENIPLNNIIYVYYCNSCNFYYLDNKNNQYDYDKYYTNFNNYKNYSIYSDKDDRCNLYLKKELANINIQTILDYGSGNGKLKQLLSDIYNVSEFDFGMQKNNNEYDCVILSHVLEHIFNITDFIIDVSINIKDNGLLYIEVPNAEYYDKLNDITPLQEINIEHINYFSKYALNKLMVQQGFYAVSVIDDYFNIKKYKYYVIRAIFKKNKNNLSFNKYIENGISIIDTYNFSLLQNYERIYIYGCGQFLFKILNYIKKYTNIINIIDDNKCYINKRIDGIDIITFDLYKKILKDNDIILCTTLIYDNVIKQNIDSLNNNSISMLTLTDLIYTIEY